MEQGWTLVLLTSLITILGCCVIYTDVIYAKLFPKRAAVKPFNIAQDTNFLICSLALSSGCLLFTSLYKLLPKSHSYLKLLPNLHENLRLLKFTQASCYLAGIGICSLMNLIIHLCTNESLVHCAHDASDEEHNNSPSHSHSHSPLPSHSPSHLHSHSHSQSHSNKGPNHNDHESETEQENCHDHSHSDSPSSSHANSVETDKYNSQTIQKSNIISTDSSSNNSPENQASILSTKVSEPHLKSEFEGNSHHQHIDVTNHPHCNPQSKPLLDKSKTISLVDLSIQKLRGESQTGECFGDIDCCTDDILTVNKLHRHTTSDLHFCSKPSEENVLFFPNKKHMITDRVEFASRYPNLDIHSPLIANDHTLLNNYSSTHSPPLPAANAQDTYKHHHHTVTDDLPANKQPLISANMEPLAYNKVSTMSTIPVDRELESVHDSLSEEDEEEEEQEVGEDYVEHHHHIKTPLSRLLSIGLQTILAITLHKFPEGFIMYSTSKTNPDLGLSIFLSMFIHNFVEGFTMTLPLYIALGSRAKALLISGTLGGFSQPLGACIGYYMFRGKLDMDDPFSILLIAVLLAITSGFLTFISLQMFASAIGFGGKQEKVLKWCFIGIMLITLSNVLL